MAGSKRATIKGAVLEFLAANQPARVDRKTLHSIRRHAAARTGRSRLPSSEYVLDILLSTDVDVGREIGGIPRDLRGRVRTGTLAEAGESLAGMAREYSRAPDRVRAEDVRRSVLRARNHVRLSLSRNLSEAKRKAKEEILLWLRVWLENPEVFCDWHALRAGDSSRSRSPREG